MLKKILFLLLPCGCINNLTAQSWNPVGGGVNGYIYSILGDTVSHSIFVGGSFSTAGIIPASNIVRWDGNNWNTLGSGLSGAVSSLSFYNGQLFAGADYGSAPGNIMNWNGSNWSMVGGGTNGCVSALAVYSGELYAGGAFDTAGTVAANYIAKWNGSSWSPVGSGMNDVVTALIVFNGELYAGGRFSIAGGNPSIGVAKWNGISWTSIGTGTTRWVYSLAIYNGELYEGEGSQSAEILKWDGSNWILPDGGVFGPLGSAVSAMTVYNNELYVGGQISNAGTSMIAVNNIAKWNGINWSAVGSGMDNGVMALDTCNGAIYAGGYFSNASGNPANHIATWPSPLTVENIYTNQTNMNVFPNPTNESFIISFILPNANTNAILNIYNVTGKLVVSESLLCRQTNKTINVSDWMEGLYFATILQDDKQIGNQKVMVIK